MKNHVGLVSFSLVAALVGLWGASAHAALGGPTGVVIPYAGKLELDGALVTGLVDFDFGVAPDAALAAPVQCRFLLRNVPVTNGEFALSIVIPAAQELCVRGKDVHLKIAVRRAGILDFIPLGTQRVTPVVAAATSGIGDFAVTGSLVAGSIVSASGNIGALTANTAAVTGALTANTAAVTGALSAGTTTVGALSAGATTVTGNLAVTGGVSVGLFTKTCSNQAGCSCDSPGFVAITGGAICGGTKHISLSVPFSDAWLVQCDGVVPETVFIRCARLTP